MTDDSGLAELLRFAQRTVPYYQNRIHAELLDEATAAQALAELPVLTRSEVRAQRGRLWSTEGDTRTWKRIRTTGTTGEPLEVVLDQQAQRQELAVLAAHADGLLGSTAWRSRDLLHLAMHGSAYSRRVPSPLHPQSQVGKWNLSRVWRLPEREFYAALAYLDGQIVTATPSVMALLVDRIGRLTPPARVSPLLVVLSGEIVTTDLRDAVAARLNTRVTSMYTLAEAGVVGIGCPTGVGYHLTSSVVVEIVAGDGSPVTSGTVGRVLVTPLANRAMPLIRYNTGDEGVWAAEDCGCDGAGRLLRLTSARPGNMVIEAGGSRVNTVDLAKVSAQLEVDTVRIRSDGDGLVVEYVATTPMTDTACAVLTSAVRLAVGRHISVDVRRIPPWSPGAVGSLGGRDGQIMPFTVPSVLAPDPVVRWLRDELADTQDLLAACLTGSALDPAATSRFSDLDLTLVVGSDPVATRWRALATGLHERLPTLRVNVSTPADLADSALVTARLLAENRPVIGDLARCGIHFPTVGAASAEARLWAQTARAVLWTRATDPAPPGSDVLREAWLATKYTLDALRYFALAAGQRTTGALTVLAAARTWHVPDYPTLVEAAEVAREHRPPPADSAVCGRRYLEAALAVVEWLVCSLRHPPSELS
ncbi:hypothetical protein [Micromonospora humida]|uniref:Phenylacetate-CoA ligase n=1 Tax=Micromonospora humida TaxID=2809018 RepID=A0ABS2IUE7_9ACTN|nr:hypothetical protein [Micromonospora humida]MBM7077942.1 hypothetical protein [Micromonospora humida]